MDPILLELKIVGILPGEIKDTSTSKDKEMETDNAESI